MVNWQKRIVAAAVGHATSVIRGRRLPQCSDFSVVIESLESSDVAFLKACVYMCENWNDAAKAFEDIPRTLPKVE